MVIKILTGFQTRVKDLSETIKKKERDGKYIHTQEHTREQELSK